MSTHSTYITLAKTQTYLEDLFKIRIINLEYFDLLEKLLLANTQTISIIFSKATNPNFY